MKNEMNPVPPTKFIKILKNDLGAHRLPHHGGSLLNHLLSTYRLLALRKNDPEVCLAGLFHNIYGTAFYKNNLVDFSRRVWLRSLIGRRAERLAYLFCICDRNFLRQSSLSSPLLLSRLDQKKLRVSQQTYRDLQEIEIVNFIDHLKPKKQKELLQVVR